MRIVTAITFYLSLVAGKYDGIRDEGRSIESTTNSNGMSCTMLVSIKDYIDREETYRLECDIDGKLFPIDWEESYVREILQKQILISGSSKIDIIDTDLSNGKIKLSQTAFQIVNAERTNRNLGDLSSSRSVLVVRVIAPDSSTTVSKDELANKVFGIMGDKANLKSQYAKCSYNKMNFTPAIYDGVVNGVMEVSISVNVTNSTSEDIQDAVTNVLGGKPHYADHVMYCLPPGTKDNWLAYAYVNSWLSVYNDKWCKYLSTQMHEIGHNLNLGHANENGVAYADQSGYMGYGYQLDDDPLMCFNSLNLWVLGWYKTKSLEIRLGENFSGNLSSIIDFDSESTKTVLIRINTEDLYDYYISYNKKAGFNSGTRDGINQVLIIKGRGRGFTYSDSELIAKLNKGDSLVLNETSTQTKITVNSIDISGNAEIDIFTPMNPTKIPTVNPTTSRQTVNPTTKRPTESPNIGKVPTSLPRTRPPLPRTRPPLPRGKGVNKYKHKQGRCRGCL